MYVFLYLIDTLVYMYMCIWLVYTCVYYKDKPITKEHFHISECYLGNYRTFFPLTDDKVGGYIGY